MSPSEVGADVTAAPDVSVRRLAGLAWPLVLHGLVTVLVASNDVVLLGREGASVVASVVVASSVLTVVVMALSAFAVGVQIEASRARGAGDAAGTRAAATGALRLLLVLGTPLVVALAVAAPWLTDLLAGDAADGGLAATYLRVTLTAVPCVLLSAVLRAHATALGRTRVVLWTGLATATTDVAVSLALVGPWGWRGVAVGTVSGYTIGALGFLLWRARLVPAERPGWPRRAAGTERALWRLGWPESLLATFSSGSGVVIVLVLGAATPEVLAAARLLDVQLSLAWVVMYSTGAALLTVLGETLGAGRPDLYRLAVRRAGLLMGGAALVLYVALAPWSPTVLGLMAGPGVAAAVGALGWLAWGQVFWQAVCALATAVCRSLRDTRAALVASLVGEYVVFAPVGLLLCRVLGWDVLGVLVAHHLFWATFLTVVVVRARRGLARAGAAAPAA